MERYVDPVLQETLYTETLPSGLKVFVVPRRGFKQATASFATHYGSLVNQFVPPGESEPVRVPDGIAHFLEHKLFESEDGDASRKFSALGAYSNAGTSWHQTEYYFTTTQNFDECLDVLLDFVQSPYFTDDSVEKEQGIIGQEIQQYQDDPNWRSVFGVLEAMYIEHPIRIDIAGTVESISKITKDLLYQCYRTFYHPSNMGFFAIGDLDPAKVIDKVAKSVGSRNYPPQSEIKIVPIEEPARVGKARVEERLVVAQPVFKLGFKDRDVGYTGKKLLRKDLVTGILLDAILSKSSPLYTELYESGLIDQRFSSDYEGAGDYGWTLMGGPTRDPDGLEKRLRDGLEDIRQRGLAEEDFERSKKKAMGRFLSAMSSSDSIANMWNHFYFKGMSLFDVLPLEKELTVTEANQRLRDHFDPDAAVTMVIKPKGQA